MDKPLVHLARIGGTDASGSEEIPILHHPSHYLEILSAYITDTAAKAGHSSNYGTFQLINKGVAAAGTTVVATHSTNVATTTSLAAFVPKAMTMATEESERLLSPGQVLTFVNTETGTAGSGDLTDAMLTIEYRIGTGGWR